MRTLRAIGSEPGAPDATGPRRRDAVLAVIVVVVASVETALRDDLVWPGLALAVTIVGALALPWRRVHPLVTTTAVIGIGSAVQLIALVRDVEWEVLGTAIVFVLLPYALGRWGSGRQAVGGAGVFAVSLALTALAGQPIGDVVGGLAVVLLAGAVGAGVRYRSISRRQHLDGIRSRERAELARELHDTVAHHVSAIAVQAQAGLTLMSSRTELPADAITEVLAVIEEQATRSLEEMRSIVGALRDGDRVELGPQHGVRDIVRLAAGNGSGPPVTVELSGEFDDLRGSVDAALYRLAREAITNARRHAADATGVVVRIVGSDDSIRLTVDDDGHGRSDRSDPGFGLVGMAERVKLLGGSFAAGPGPDGGWNVTVELPCRGAIG